MTRPLSLLFLVFGAVVAGAEVKRSSRNLTPLTQQKNTPAASQSGRSGLLVAAPQKQDEAALNTVTRVTYVGPTRGWGFVKATSPYYSPQGKRLGTLPGGTLFKYADVKTSSKNAVLVSTVRRGDAWEGPVLLDCTDIAGYEGEPESLDPQMVADLAAYFTLLGKVSDRRDALADQSLAANPHFESARQSQLAYQDSVEKAAALEAQMNTLTGARKTKALDELRALKYEQVAIKAKADQTAADYKAWKDTHPLDPAKVAADPVLQRLTHELEQAKAKVASLVPKS